MLQWGRATSFKLSGDRRAAEQVVGCLGRGLVADLAAANDFADGLKAGPAVVGQPVDGGDDRGGEGLGAAVVAVAVDDGLRRGSVAVRVVDVSCDITVQRARFPFRARRGSPPWSTIWRAMAR